MLLMVKRWFMRQTARRDARLGINQVDERVTAMLGARPEFDPETNSHDQQVLDDLRPELVEEHRDDVRRTEDEASRHSRPGLKTLGIVGLIVLEALGCNLLMGTLGYENPERLGFGVLLACFLIFITHVTWQLWSDKKSRIFFLAAFVLAAVTLSVAILRVEDRAAAEDTTRLGDVATGVITLALTVGAAFLAEYLINERRAGARVWKEMDKERRRLRRAERRQWWARTYTDSLGRRQKRWTETAKQLRAAYMAEFRAERARTGGGGDGTTTPSTA